MSKRQTILWAAFAACLGMAANLRADAIPYPTTGQVAAANTFTATATGDITAYFYGSSASNWSTVGLLVNNLSNGWSGLINHLSSPGDSADLGHVNAGDTLVFELYVWNTGQTWYSDPARNSDGINHTYATTFSGSQGIPAGTYIAFEDLARSSSDLDYNDYQFVATNVSFGTVPSVPEPAIPALAGVALAALAFARRRFRRDPA